jgi:hypothetical protein
MKEKDINKGLRDSMNETLETKFLTNLQWSMLFFCFNYIANHINEENDFKKLQVQKEFIKSWKKYANMNIAMTDLKIINDILNSPKNIFYSALQNDDEVTESTELYQEKYNSIIKKIESFFLNTMINGNKSLDDED